MEIAERVAVVTGGGVGIGRAVCLELASAGAGGLIVNYAHSQEEAEATANELSERGCDAVAVRADVSRDPDAQLLINVALERFGRLDILVNNAGITRFIPYADLDGLTDAVWTELMGVNLMGTFYCSRAAASALREAAGAIVNVASITAHRAVGSSIAYGVSKAAVLHLTRALAIALAPDVRVNSVSPGAVTTRLLRRLFGEEEANNREARLAETTPLRRVAIPADVARAVVAIIGTDVMTGQDVILDGGRHVTY